MDLEQIIPWRRPEKWRKRKSEGREHPVRNSAVDLCDNWGVLMICSMKLRP
jgi:hypothetical protein